ncbi:uncharacterized protein EDB91DRAFT_1060137 [Suillus paluster]|uniref:uncharacterized protein n=1 Tax=Suillus paluster TaxID=48578 RepID=UPI001B878CBC|nr:uncharacterized protein EDB91DRAFT_1060137 [Suillus paluster]KAG1729206.1 hypothetical protein EDB91DRAFT_1060137 [Suillus paluster]
MRSNSSHLPTCYDHHTFFDGAENAFLVARSTFQLTPGLFHQPRFFVWLPHLLVDRIPCPSCLKAGRQVTRGSRVYLQKHGFANQPRRVVDIDRNIFIVGYRYVCGHKDCRKSFQSWSPSIIHLLPAPIADQFVFRLTHRSGLSNCLAMLLRESFRSGVGPDQFTTMIESFHYRHFNHLHCQFLEMVSNRSSHGSLSSCWTATSPFGDFGAQDGYAGYVLHAPYFARFYDMLVEESAPAARQLIASLPADIIKQDHSFKAIKHLGKTDGVPTFNALFMTVNQYSEIRSMNFTPSKGQDGWAPVLSAMLPSLASFGHSPPKIVFTDNIRADKDKLLSIFPSLSANVTPVQLPSAQDLLLFPEDWSYVPLTTTYQVNHRFNIIMNQHTPTTPIVAMFSIKWPINAATGEMKLFMQDGFISLPHSLLTFIQSRAYCKVGINVTSNLQRLHADCIPASRLTPFAGQLDVGQMASERNAAHIGNTSMTTLCTNVLRKHVTQDPMICISPLWGISELPPSFIQHAALDIYATWSIYHALTAIEAPQKVTFSTPGGTAVTMYAPDGRTIAQGVIAPDRLASFGGVNVTKTRVIMVVHEVLVPAYLISGSLLSSRTPTPLSAFGHPPFSILSQANHLQTSIAAPLMDLEAASGFSEDQHLMSSMSTLPANSDSSNDVNFPSPFETVPELDEPDSEAIPEQTVGSSSVDETALQAISQLLVDIVKFSPQCFDLI